MNEANFTKCMVYHVGMMGRGSDGMREMSASTGRRERYPLAFFSRIKSWNSWYKYTDEDVRDACGEKGGF